MLFETHEELVPDRLSEMARDRDRYSASPFFILLCLVTLSHWPNLTENQLTQEPGKVPCQGKPLRGSGQTGEA